MGHTQAEKIIAARMADGAGTVRPGDLVEVAVDVVLSNDVTAPIAIREFERLGVERVFDPAW